MGFGKKIHFLYFFGFCREWQTGIDVDLLLLSAKLKKVGILVGVYFHFTIVSLLIYVFMNLWDLNTMINWIDNPTRNCYHETLSLNFRAIHATIRIALVRTDISYERWLQREEKCICLECEQHAIHTVNIRWVFVLRIGANIQLGNNHMNDLLVEKLHGWICAIVHAPSVSTLSQKHWHAAMNTMQMIKTQRDIAVVKLTT